MKQQASTFDNRELFTIGHSTHSVEYFTGLLKQHSIAEVCDVRSHPYSKHNPQFNREKLKTELKKHDIEYIFLGKELGARSENSACYIDGKVQYNRLAKEESFKHGINSLIQEIEQCVVALMCAEKDPITCHRTILVCRAMRSPEIQIKHILSDGKIETNTEAEYRMKSKFGGLFDENIEDIYDLQSQEIAYNVKKEEQVATSVPNNSDQLSFDLETEPLQTTYKEKNKEIAYVKKEEQPTTS